MILFVVDQVAGAEYILPLLCKWSEESYNEWKVVCSPVAASFLGRYEIDCVILNTPTIENVQEIIDQCKPKIAVLSSSSDSLLEEFFLLELKQRSIPSCKFIDTWVNYSKRFEKSYPDKILTIDQKAKDEMIAENIPEELIEIVGQPYFEFCMSLGDAKTSKTIEDSVLLITQPVSRYYGVGLGYDEKSFVSTCLDSWQDLNRDFSKLNILVHPTEECRWYQETALKYSADIRILRGDVCDVRAYSLVVGMFSSVMVQSFLAGVSTVSLQPGADGEDMSFLSRHGYVQRFTTRGDFYNYLNDFSDCRDRDLSGVSDLQSSLKGSCMRLENFIFLNGKAEQSE